MAGSVYIYSYGSGEDKNDRLKRNAAKMNGAHCRKPMVAVVTIPDGVHYDDDDCFFDLKLSADAGASFN